MTDIASIARTARESLSRGLSALQSDPNVPPQLLELAGTIAQAMGAMHQIERNNGTQVEPFAQTALAHLRAALTQLQAQPATHPAVGLAMEAVAGALGSVHALGKLAAAPVAPQVAAQLPPAPVAPAQVAPAPVAPAAQFPVAHADPFAKRPNVVAAPATTANSQRPPSPAEVAGNAATIDADLGTHSPTNFYKGLAGNDVVDHGGLFVSTYMIPKLGATVRLRVSMPGGYEFEANAIVRWKREAGGDAAPGFGAQLTQISAEARQLVYRYVKNREPIFFDDF